MTYRHQSLPPNRLAALGRLKAALQAVVGGRSKSQPDWPRALRSIERKRRQRAKQAKSIVPIRKGAYFAQATWSSFRLEGLDCELDEVEGTLQLNPVRKAFRSRIGQRIRNHSAILLRMDKSLRLGESLKTPSVVRWYTSVSCGLSTTSLDESTMQRAEEVVRRINSPQLRLQPALQDIARLHAQLLIDPLVPSFNGILARLLLTYHLGRCGLPAVLFDPATPAPRLINEGELLLYLLELIDTSFATLLNGKIST